MHELAIGQALITQIEDIARERAARVREVCLRVGPLSGVEPKLLEDTYPLVCAGTAAEGSQLDIEETDIRVRCRICSAETVAAPNRLLCAACGDWIQRPHLVLSENIILDLLVRQNHCIIRADACNPALARNVRPRLVQVVAVPA